MTATHPGRRPRGRRILILPVCLSGLARPQDRPRVLLSNDDNYQHPGLRALVGKLAPLAEVVVSAPAVNQSGVSHATTFKEPIPVESWTDGSVRWHAISAAPATCVRLALGLEKLLSWESFKPLHPLTQQSSGKDK